MSSLLGLLLLAHAAQAQQAPRSPSALPEAPAARGGYRVTSAQPGASFSTRLAMVPGSVWVIQEVPHLRLSADRISLDLELSFVQATDTVDVFELGIGRGLAAMRIHLGADRRHALLIEGASNATPVVLQPTAWGSQSKETLPGSHVLGGWEWDLPLTGWAWTLHLAGGVSSERYVAPRPLPHAELGMAQVLPVGGGEAVYVVLEEEAHLADHTHLSQRVLARVPAGDVATIDLGAQYPLLTRNPAPAYPQLIALIRAPL